MSWGEPPPVPPPPPPPPSGGGYPPPGYGYGYGPQPVGRTNGMAVAALVLGLVGIVTIFFFIPSILALIFGLIARSQIRERGEQGKGMAIAGIVLGAAGIALMIVIIILIAAFGTWDDTTTYGLLRLATAASS